MTKERVDVVTHSGNFHADEVFACATLALSFGNINIVRSRDEKIISESKIVVDVGGEYSPEKGRFDHHQNGGAGQRENNIPYASFGLIWKEYGEKLCINKEVWGKVDERLVAPIDAGDNGFELIHLVTEVSPYSISAMIGSFNASWSEDNETINDDNFFKMVQWAKEILSREILYATDFVRAKSIVEKSYEEAKDKRIIILDGPYPASDVLQQHPEPLYVVKPRRDGKWGIKCVSTKESNFSNRKNLPKEWAGLVDEELQNVTGIKDALFCHRGLFLALAASKDGALGLARLAVEY